MYWCLHYKCAPNSSIDASTKCFCLQGYTKLRSFRDNRLADYWTTTKIPEYVWFPNLGNQPEVTVTTNNTLWEMGNK